MQADRPIDPGVVLPPGCSQLERLAGQPRRARDEAVDHLSYERLAAIEWNWPYVARAGQLPPPGAWRTWLIVAGRGFGKTRAGAEWVRAHAETDGRVRIALVAATLAEARAVMVEGESGLLAISPPGLKPKFESSLRKLTWENGAQAFLYSAGEPDSLRGPQHHLAWCDEIAKWERGQETWDNLAFGLRLGELPRTVVTTTPRPVALVKALLAREVAGEVATSRGRTADNAAHLAPAFIAAMRETYEGTATGRQELDGELIEDVDGALWTRALIERCRVTAAPATVRVVVGVDPPAGAAASSDACGIVVVALGEDARGYVLADASVQGGGPEAWAAAVAGAARAHLADRVVAEANNGGAMVESVLRAADEHLPVKLVHASHGKAARAEPVAALYARNRVAHVGAFAALEDEMAGLVLGGRYEGPGRSPDRADALVWAVTELMLGKRPVLPGVRTFA